MLDDNRPELVPFALLPRVSSPWLSSSIAGDLREGSEIQINRTRITNTAQLVIA